jgi:hypothetical protein
VKNATGVSTNEPPMPPMTLVWIEAPVSATTRPIMAAKTVKLRNQYRPIWSIYHHLFFMMGLVITMGISMMVSINSLHAFQRFIFWTIE